MTAGHKQQNLDHYRIKVKGCLDKKWKGWFEGMTITCKEGNTILTGPVPDQPALHGLFNRIRDLNLKLISVELLESHGDKK